MLLRTEGPLGQEALTSQSHLRKVSSILRYVWMVSRLLEEGKGDRKRDGAVRQWVPEHRHTGILGSWRLTAQWG